ncbi:MAG: L-serine ammonia-lyase, iron-sulfur-dependent, subunit alpha [Dysgonamonadaceae bacterium]|jgi:L-cysteine desulfidase|nr:L-serine ammonia-lyase, iron-sulfur-dependent, subunit alpha [Dysgonamonadaceae bacterium]
MIDKKEREAIIRLIHREVVPAIGCTEPVAVAFAVAKAKETLGQIPDKITVNMSANVLKNAMGVGIPGTGMIGLPIAIALGALIGKSEYGLEVLKDITPDSLEAGKKMIADRKIKISLDKNAPDKLYIEAVCTKGENSAKATVCSEHTRITEIERNGEILFSQTAVKSAENDEETPELKLRKVYDFAMETPLDEIRFVLESAKMNREASEKALAENYGHSLGRTMRGIYEKAIMGDSMLSKILAATSSACDARMAGAMIPVMTNSGSGNQGITATMPVAIYAEETMQSEESLIRALALSHLTVIYIKQSMGRLSALCGCIVASTGSACGITYLMGGTYEQICFAVKNMIANLAGIICDGAKPGCSLKVSGSVTTAVFSAMMAMENKCVQSVEGIIDDDVDRSIRNLTHIASSGMLETDRMILEIMTNKGKEE